MENAGSFIAAVINGRELGEFQKCQRCEEYDYSGIHQCKESWDAIVKDYQDEDDPGIAFGDDAESAALWFAEKHFYGSGDYSTSSEVWVRRDPDAEWEKFTITVESVPSFSAEKIS